MSNYVSFDYKKLVEEYVAVYPHEANFFNLLEAWEAPFSNMRTTILAGGIVMKLYNKMPFENSDIDIWCTVPSGPNLLFSAFTDAGWEAKKSKFSYTFDLGIGRKVQIIRQCHGDTPASIVGFFDFTNCKCYTNLKQVWINEKAVKCLADNKLKDGQPHKPYINLTRTKKYIALGFKPAGVLKRKIREARTIELVKLLAPKDTVIDEAVNAPVVRNIRRNQQLNAPAAGAAGHYQVNYDPVAVAGRLQYHAAVAVQQWAAHDGDGWGNGGGIQPAGDIGADPAFAQPVPEPVDYPDDGDNFYIEPTDEYETFCGKGEYLPKYHAWIERERMKRAQEEYNKRKVDGTAANYGIDYVNANYFSNYARMTVSAPPIQSNNALRPQSSYYVQQNQAPRGPRQGR